MSKPSNEFWRSLAKPLALALILSGLWLFSPAPLAAQEDGDLTDLFSEDPEDFAPNQTSVETFSPAPAPAPLAAPAASPAPAPAPAPASAIPPLPPTVPVVAPPPPIPDAAPGVLPPAGSTASPYELNAPNTQSQAQAQAQSFDESNDEGILGDPFGDAPSPPRASGPLDSELTMTPLAPDQNAAPGNESESAPSNLATMPIDPEPGYSNFQGEVITPPPPPWQRASRDTVGTPSASGPLPDFDTSQGRWQQMEIGQFDRPRNAQGVGANESIGAQNANNSNSGAQTPQAAASAQITQTAQAEAPTGTPSGAPTGAAQTSAQNDPVRELFSDLLPETPEPLAPAAPPPPPTTQPSVQASPQASPQPSAQPSSQPSAQPSTSGASVSGTLSPPGSNQNSLNELFSDFSMSDINSNAPVTPNDATGAGTQEAAPSGLVSLPLSPPPAATPSVPIVPPLPENERSLAVTPPSASMAMEASSLPEPEDDDANLAIARAGSLLVEEGLRPKVGSAAILEPGATSAAASAKDQTKPATAANKAKTTAKSASPKSAGSSGAKAAKPKAAAAPRPNISVILVNETGRPNVGEDYRMVLSRMGYKVVSVTERGPSGAGGQTVITYQSGQQSQARALARRLPGPRQLVASQDSLPAEAVIVIR